jgi:hypothetical protein
VSFGAAARENDCGRMAVTMTCALATYLLLLASAENSVLVARLLAIGNVVFVKA